MRKQAVVIHSGGMDSSLCLALAIRKFGCQNVLSLSFNYNQRHSSEMLQAIKICRDWEVEHVILSIGCLKEITDNSLVNRALKIEHKESAPPNTLVIGRNGLMARLGAIHAHHLGASFIYMGVIEAEEWNSGYRDCSRRYMDLKQEILRIDLADPAFEIVTPLVHMSKLETLELGKELGILDYLLSETITCYEGISREGCRLCPACQLRNEGVRLFSAKYPMIQLPYDVSREAL